MILSQFSDFNKSKNFFDKTGTLAVLSARFSLSYDKLLSDVFDNFFDNPFSYD